MIKTTDLKNDNSKVEIEVHWLKFTKSKLKGIYKYSVKAGKEVAQNLVYGSVKATISHKSNLK
jgi:hypothetical protein